MSAPSSRRPPWRRSRGRNSVVFVIVAILLVVRLWTNRPAPEVPQANGETVHVKRVVDGDTLLLESGTRVRLIGIDTPESVKPNSPVEPFGPEASEFTKKMVEGRDVTLEFDRERLDQYDRLLAFVFIDGKMLNEELIRAGLSPAETQYSYRSDIKRRFINAEKEAKAARRGIWSLEPEAPSR